LIVRLCQYQMVKGINYSNDIESIVIYDHVYGMYIYTIFVSYIIYLYIL